MPEHSKIPSLSHSNSNDNANIFYLVLTGVVSPSGAVVDGALTTNFIAAMPNPFSGKTAISFSLEEAAPVSMKIFDMLGKEVYSCFGK